MPENLEFGSTDYGTIDSNSYDEIPYPSHPIEVTHPDHLYSMAKLFRLDAPIPDNASILELGCASGGNIIPLAVQMPNANIVGIDLSTRQIAEGQTTVDALGLKNIKLIAMDFHGLDVSFEPFDYILCHGVFSWVPHESRLFILKICQSRLSPNGIAYISYNAYPGWFARGMIRQMMLPYVSQLRDPMTRVQKARAFLAFLADSTEGQDTPYSQSLRNEIELLAKNPDAYLFHEHLEADNQPFFFYQFMEMTSGHQLQFLCEAILATMITGNLPPKAVASLKQLTSNLHEQSQYMDFVTNRMFRQSLLCHQDRTLDRVLGPSRLEGGRFAGTFQVDDPNVWNNLLPEIEVIFKCSNGKTIQTRDMTLKAMLFALTEVWPSSLSAPEICGRIAKKLSTVLFVGPSEQSSIANLVNSSMLHMVLRGDLALRFLPDRFAMAVSDNPIASPLARLQAAQGGSLTTERHTILNPDPLTRMIVPLLDGTRNKESLGGFIGELAREKQLVKTLDNRVVDMDAVQRATLNKILEKLMCSAMLIG